MANTPTPAESEEFTTRLLKSYESIKAQAGGVVSIQDLINALNTDRELLRTLEECADWSTQARHECYRELFIAVQQEEKDRTEWEKKRKEGKSAMKEAGMGDISNKIDDDSDAFQPTGVTFKLMCQFLPACMGSNANGLQSFAPSQPESKEEKEEKEDRETTETEGKNVKENKQNKEETLTSTKLHDFYVYHSNDVERRIAKSSSTNILNLNGCSLKRFPDLLPKQLRDIRQMTMQRNSIVMLPAEMGYCVALERLICSNNKLYRLPQSITRLPYLLTLDISDNQLEYLPPTIGCLIHLRYMSAANNKLESLPPSLGQLVQLNECNLDGTIKMNSILLEKLNKSLPDILAYLQSIDICLKLAIEHESTTKAPGSNVYFPGISDIESITERQLYQSDTLLKHAEFGVVGRIVDVRRAIYRSRAELCTKVRGTPLSLKHTGLISLSDDVLPSEPSVVKTADLVKDVPEGVLK